MSYVSVPNTKCMDGTQAGYFIHEGSSDSSSNLFVIFLEGGGSCRTKEHCDSRINSRLGSSDNWPESMEGKNFLSSDCEFNPDFCNAKASVYIGYCTSDIHLGQVSEPDEDTNFGYYFHGRLNFIEIIEDLIDEHGLGEDGNQVLLTGQSAGAAGTTFNVDLLSDLLPNAIVKAAPIAEWGPSALSDDLPIPNMPSDYPHFANGENGNESYDAVVLNGEETIDVWNAKPSLSQECLEDYDDKYWGVCVIDHFSYKYIKSQIYLVHSQYDSFQVHNMNFAPTQSSDENEIDKIKEYIEFWGNATRNSLQTTIMIDESLHNKTHVDGVFSPSCKAHIPPTNVLIDGYSYMPLVHDWFFQSGEYEDQYKLIETCEPLEGNEDYVIPCNAKETCHYDIEISWFCEMWQKVISYLTNQVFA